MEDKISKTYKMEKAKTFSFTVELDNLIYMGIEGLNECLDGALSKAGINEYATDISYTPVGITVTGEIIIEASYIPEYDENDKDL